MATKPAEAVLTPLVAEGLRLIAEAEAIKIERDAIVATLKAKDEELAAVNEQLIALGAGRYRDADDHLATVVSGSDPKLSPDRYELPRDEALFEKVEKLAGDHFPKLIETRKTFFCRDGFNGIAGALLTPARARDIIQLCLVPGVLSGGRRAHVRWK